MRLSVPIYEIYALKYAGPFTSSAAFVLWNEGWDERIERNYYIWAIKGNEGWTIVDTGTGLTQAAQRKLVGYVNPVDVLTRIGIDENNVENVILRLS
jgi:glyoxylase-like metal-dependent hydrolase (beta-lactamase superfamily II)